MWLGSKHTSFRVLKWCQTGALMGVKMRSLRVPGGGRTSPGCSLKGVATKNIYYFPEISLRELPGPPRDPLFRFDSKIVVFFCSLFALFWAPFGTLFEYFLWYKCGQYFDTVFAAFSTRFGPHFEHFPWFIFWSWSSAIQNTRISKNTVKPQLILLLSFLEFLDFWCFWFLCAFLRAVFLHRFWHHFGSLLEHFWGHFWCTFGV